MLRHALGPIVFGALSLAACGGESFSEFTIEQALDASGEDIDFEFEEGGFRIAGEEGEVTFNFDSEDGTFSFDSSEGSGTVQFDDEGNVTFDGDQGSGTASIDAEGNIVVETEAGDATFSISGEDSSATFSSDDGSGFTTQTIPDGWPPYIGAPATLIADQSFFSVFEDSSGISYTANLSFDPSEDFAAAVSSRLAAAGFDDVSVPGIAGFTQWTGQGLSITISHSPGQAFIAAAPE